MLISSDLFSQLRKDILQGKFAQGYKLIEQQICSEYNVSRTPVREAFKQLEMEGLIETIPNRGAFVIGFTKQDIRDMFELRKAYEIQAVKWAIERISEDEFNALEETFEFMEFYTSKKDIEKMLNINTSFHQLIYKASHNKMLQHILSSYQLYIKYTRGNVVFGEDYLPSLLAEHRKIFEAFQESDVEKGVKATEEHMDNSHKRFYF